MTDFQLEHYAKRRLHIPHFRGVFMRDTLPSGGPWEGEECAIVNLDSSRGSGTHWVCYRKTRDGKVQYFDSYGNLKPSTELIEYLRKGGCRRIEYNRSAYQSGDSEICGQLCLLFLKGDIEIN